MDDIRKRTAKKPTLCWNCARATGNGCSWAEVLMPVEGWEALPTQLRINNGHDGLIDSFHVISCPRFIRDAKDNGLIRTREERNHG